MRFDDDQKYRFTFTGECEPGFDKTNVARGVSRLFNVDVSEVEKIFSGEMVFKKEGLNLFTAEQYRKAFSRIGAKADCRVSDGAGENDGIARVGAAGEGIAGEGIAGKGGAGEEGPGMTTCPSCGRVQEGGEECEACGVYFKKYLAIQKRLKEKERASSIPDAPAGGEETEETDFRKTRVDPDARKAKTGVRFGGVLLVCIFFTDSLLQWEGLDFGYWPYLLSNFVLVYGGWYFMKIKKYPPVLGLLGMASFFGLAVMYLLPDRSKSGKKLRLPQKILAFASIFIAVYWAWDSYKKHEELKEFYTDSKMMESDYGSYPSAEPVDDPAVLMLEFAKIKAFLHEGLTLLGSNEYRPNQVRNAANHLFENIASFFVRIQLQQYLHQTRNGETPDHFRDERIDRMKRNLNKQISDFLKKNEELVESVRFREAYHAWFYHYFRAGPIRHESEDVTDAAIRFNEQLLNLHVIVAEYNGFKAEGFPVGKIRAPRPDGVVVSSIKIKNESIVEFRFAENGMGEASGKLLVMVFYKRPCIWQGRLEECPTFFCIGGDATKKYLGREYSIFKDWAEKK